MANNKNLNVFLPSIDNSYFANHIQEVLNPILDDTGNYSFYNIHNEMDFSNEAEQSTDYDNRRNVHQGDKIFELNKFANSTNNNLNTNVNNYNYMGGTFKSANKNNIHPMMIGVNREAEKRKFLNFNGMIN